MTTALEGGKGSGLGPGRSLPPGKTRYPLYIRLGGPQGRSGQVRKISPPPGFDPRTVQHVAQFLYRLSYPAHGLMLLSNKRDRQFTCKRNTVGCWGRHCRRAKANNITYSECVSVDLVVQHVKRLHRLILSYVVRPAVRHFLALSHKRHDFGNKSYGL